MTGALPSGVLRVNPAAIPALRAAYAEALDELSRHLLRLRREALIAEPWLGDPISADSAAHYQERVMDAPDGPFAALLAYEAELIRILDNLQQMEDLYRRTEGDNAALWGRT